MSKRVVMVPIEEMTDEELTAEARKREHAGEGGHAAELLKYLHMRWRYGRDPHKWPTDPDGPRRKQPADESNHTNTEKD